MNIFCKFASITENEVKKCLFPLVALLLVACGNKQNSDTHWEKVSERIQQLDDSIVKHAPSVPQMIREGMEQSTDSIEWYAYYIRWASYFTMSATPDSLLPYAAKTIRFAQQNKSKLSPEEQRRLNAVEGHAYEMKASLYQHFRVQSDSIFEMHEKAYSLIQQSDQSNHLPIISGNLADAYAQNNRLPEASSWYRKALKLTDSLGLDQNVKASLYMGLGRIYQNLFDYDNAELYYGLAGERLDSMSPHEQLYYLNNYGNFFYYQKEYEKALQQFEQMEQLLHKINGEETFEMFLCLLNKADVYLNLDSLEKSISCVDRAEPFFLKNKVKEAVFYCQVIRFGVAVKRNDIAGAEQLLDSIMNDKSIEHSLVDIRDQYVFDYYMKVGKTSKALQLMIATENREDSVSRSRERMRAADIMMRVSEDTLRLRHELEMTQQKMETQRAYIGIFVLTLIVVALIFSFCLVWLNNRKKQTQQELDLMKLRLLGVRQRISPHFVFNVLNHRIGTATPSEERELMKLVKLIRENLDMTNDVLISLSEELHFVRDYVALEQELMENLVYTVDVDTKLKIDELSIPSMFVQILAENAIKHGLKGLMGEKKLNIKVVPKKETFLVIVTDNGRGLEKRATKGTTTGNGLAIIRQTIEIFNTHNPEKEMTLDIRNLYDDQEKVKGCQATLQIPKFFNDLE